ncbi:hypothetical protein ACSTK2_23460, partial [Vibrio parahaemolyticus]
MQIDAAGELHPKHLTESGRREIRALLRGFNLEISALNCPLRKGLDVAEDLQPRLDYLRDAMQLAF